MTTNKDWREELNEQLSEIYSSQNWNAPVIKIRNLIQSLLDQKDKEKQEALDKQKEEIIKVIEVLEAPKCIDDSCEFVHEGYFKAIEEIINKIKEI